MSVYFGAHNIISPLGLTSQQNYNQILLGNTGLQKQTFSFSESEFMCAKLNETAINNAFSKPANPSLFTVLEKICLLSITDVLNQSTISLEDKNTLLILSTTKGNIDVLENKYTDIPKERAYLHELSAICGRFFKTANTPLIVSNACISGLLAIIVAKRLIETKRYKNIIVCGADLVTEFTLSGFKSFNALSSDVCKPFDFNRNGINLGEAAASILLSSDNLSTIKITAGSSANDANHISGPSREGSGLFQSIENTLLQSANSKIDFICAHGIATEYNDEMEAVAFSRANLTDVPLNSLKAYYGHTLGAAGLVESIISIMALKENTLIKSAGFEKTGTSKALNIITQTEKTNLNSCLKTASGFGGCNASAVFEKI